MNETPVRVPASSIPLGDWRISRILFLTFLFLFLFVSGSEAGESIRVAVREGLSSVRITSNSSLLMKDARGRVLYPQGITSMEIKPVKRGLMVNDLLVRAPVVKVISPKNDLVVEGQSFHGLIEIRKQPEGLILINELDIEDYLKGVVPEEMAFDWPLEALKAQAVVARTYALYQKYNNRKKEYDLVSTILDQVYGGVSREKPETSMAVALTDGEVVTYQGELAMTLYHSTSAGRTEDIRELLGKDLFYLRGVACPFDEGSPYYQWERKIPLDTFEDSLRRAGLQMGALATLTPFRWTPAGRVKKIRILHSQGELFLEGRDARRIIGYRVLPSTQFDVVTIGNDIVLRGKGYGHGLGLCQWGTKVQAERGKSSREIIEYYYPEVEIQDYRTLQLERRAGP